jgi:Undecaprenyl-phosphate galactose phosphotransferase WbaP
MNTVAFQSPTSLRQRLLSVATGRALLLMAADIAALCAAFLAGGVVYLLFSEYMVGGNLADLAAAAALARPVEVLVLGSGLMIWFAHKGHYTQRLPFWVEASQIVASCLFVLLCDGFLQFALKNAFSRLWLVHTWLLAVPLLLLARQAARVGLARLSLWEIRTLLVGSPDRIAEATTLLHSERNLGYVVVAQETFETLEQAEGGTWQAACDRHGAQMVVVAAEETEQMKYRDLLARLALERLPFICIQSLAGLPVLSLKTYHLLGQDVLLLVEQGRLDPTGRVLKAVFDRLGALALLVLLSPLLPLFIVLVVLIRRDGGSVFYADQRVGRRGRPFACLKFRTMRVNSDQVLADFLAGDPAAREEWDRTKKLRHDPRVTGVGMFMRTRSIDELPQLLNILRGEMSLVGPRPIPVWQSSIYGRELGYYGLTKPGMTGLWQVSGRSLLDYAQLVRLNTWYVKNWSFWLDIVILAKTIPVVFCRKGAF